MKTKCYCIYCPKHPLFEKRNELEDFPVGWYVGKLIFKPEEQNVGFEVDCLEPESPAFDELDIEPSNYEFPVTAYGDGQAQTGFEGSGFEVSAYCKNEKYVEKE